MKATPALKPMKTVINDYFLLTSAQSLFVARALLHTSLFLLFLRGQADAILGLKNKLGCLCLLRVSDAALGVAGVLWHIVKHFFFGD